ncbi:MAG: alkaline phosphatase family protein [Proteobacteria bacterium]|nr:alkaline phosphatase family protein [Pseudomonadota bacterium]
MRRNLLLITADQWRADCLSALDHACVQTPNLDALARDGVIFTCHYAQAAPCGPSRASLHTGLYLMNHRSVINGTPLDRRHRNWAQIVRDAGYDPLLFGYTDTSLDPRDYPEGDPLLSTYEGVLPGITPHTPLTTQDLTTWVNWLRGRGVSIPQRTSDLYYRKANQPEWEEGGPTPAPLLLDNSNHDTCFLTEQVIEHIEAARDPWCIHLSWLRPHPPWIAPAPYHTRYAPDTLPDFVRATDVEEEGLQHPWLAYELRRAGHRVRDNQARLRRLQASYYGLMSEVDDNLGRLIAHLKASGQYDNTLIIFTSDHGEQMGDHWLLGKCGYFDQSFHIPLIIRDPHADADATRGSRVDAFTENVDIMPTLLDWFDLDAPSACDGASLLPFVAGRKAPSTWRDCVHWEFDFRDPTDTSAETALNLPMHACSLGVIRDERYKYVHFAGLPPLLFDLRDDPAELHDRSNDPACAGVMLAYAQRMLSWRMRHADQTLTDQVLTGEGVVSRSGLRW